VDNIYIKVVLALVLGIVIGWFSTKFTAIPTVKENEITPTITGIILSPTTTPKITTKPTNVTNVKYLLPAGWKTVSDEQGTVEAGYDPIKYRPGTAQTGIELWEIIQGSYRTPDWIVINIYPYDGGSRYQFFFDVWGSIPAKNEIGSEENLTFGNKSCIVLHKVYVSQWNSEWVMCDIGNGKALVVSTRSPQSLLSTLRAVRILR
jgi:hypothetical protein